MNSPENHDRRSGESKGGMTGKRNGARRKGPKTNNSHRLILRGVKDPLFPVTFFLRNLEVLAKERKWSALPLRVRRLLAARMLRERVDLFLEVKAWLGERIERRSWMDLKPNNGASHDPSGYCDNCGRCCEVASGFPDFPLESVEIPARWKRIFGDGLGRCHRFCGFMWEFHGSGRSLCAIHPWRSKPCRVFEREECEYLKEGPLFPGPSSREEMKASYRLVSRLLRSALRPHAPYTPTEGRT
jgi:hypothetical protein